MTTTASPAQLIPAATTDGTTGLCLAIVGSRDFPDLRRVLRFVHGLPAGIVVATGGARGVDRCAAAAARARGLEVTEHLADWDRHGTRAGFIRNRTVALRCDRMVAFWDTFSSGTADAITCALRRGRPVTVVLPRSAGSRPVVLTNRLAAPPVSSVLYVRRHVVR
ncbi:MAG TPA: SLOG family protein [Thermoanaerobaculia bacterium]|nr:SLOG family protein [Thermoanaerobaculia bacterium]